ncbi:hypothetical protein [Methylobacterium trifolii]|uniref:hypothetical protein n=1 Tax=Methylobacterium trifolii TaxID=1003092 RepID=UPI001EDED4F1|nr:hypothetical protein [Methylobacterium trifolii]
MAKALDLIAGAVAFKVGGIGAAAGTYGAKVGQRALLGGVGTVRGWRSGSSDAVGVAGRDEGPERCVSKERPRLSGPIKA